MIKISRAEAIALGQTRYFTGKPCKHGHVAERYVSGCGQCITCTAGWNASKYDGSDKTERKRRAKARYAAKPQVRDRAKERKRGVAEHEIPPPLVAGHCDLCEEPAAKLSWDHDHDLEGLGFTPLECHRGWLCFHCNTGIGKLGDNARGLARALDYVSGKRHRL